MKERRKYRDRSHGFCCCSHPTTSSVGTPLLPDGRALIQNTGYLTPGLSSTPGRRAGRRAGARTDPSNAIGGPGSLPGADLQPSEIDVSEKYLAFDGEPCYSDSQPEPPLFTVFFINFTINQKGVSGYFFYALNRTLVDQYN